MRSIPSFVVLAFALSAAGCGTSFTSTRAADPVLIANAQSPAEVRAAVVRALTARHFATKSEEPGRIVARLDRGDTTLEVSVEYSGERYLVHYISSTGLKTKEGADGELLVDQHWASWVKGLKARIGEELARPAKERAAAEQRERDYQLMIEQHRTAQAQANARAAQAQVPLSTPSGIPVQVIQVPVPMPNDANVDVNHSSRSGSQRITCCINGSLYVCPSQAAFSRCMSLAPDECQAQPNQRCN